MKKIDLGQALSILANVGVIAGIILLSIELSQNNRLMASQASYNRLQNSVSGIEMVTTDDELALALYNDINGQELSQMEEFLLRFHYTGVFQKWLWEFRQSENGLIPEADLPVAYMAEILGSRPLMLALYRDQQFVEQFPDEFIEFLDQNVAKRELP